MALNNLKPKFPLVHVPKKEPEKPVNEKDIKQSTFSFLLWAQEYSKKVVSAVFWIYVLLNVLFCAAVWISVIRNGAEDALVTLITETNQTFREIGGGYLLKSVIENSMKGICSVVEKFLDTKSSKDDEDEDDPDDPGDDDMDDYEAEYEAEQEEDKNIEGELF